MAHAAARRTEHIPQDELQHSLDEVVHESLGAFLTGIGVLFVVLAVLDVVTEPPSLWLPLVGSDLVIALVCTVGALLYGRGALKVDHAEPTVVLVALLALGDILVSQSLSPDNSGGFLPVLVAIGVASFLLHRGWFAVMLAGSLVTLAGLELAPVPSTQGPLPLVAVVAGLALAILIFWTRLSAYRSLLIERNRAERYAGELEVSNRDLERFAYAAAHDLQEPIRTVVSHMQLLERRHGEALPGEAQETVDFVVEAGHRMKSQVDALLDYSRVQARQPNVERVALDSILNEVLEDLQVRLHETGGIVERTALPMVRGDPALLREVLMNLLANSLVYHGDGTPRVRVTSTTENGMVRVEVQDEGMGVPEEHQEEVFDLFKRLHPASSYPGTGIGLALVKRIVGRHGGEVGVESQEGKGATFWFTVPAA